MIWRATILITALWLLFSLPTLTLADQNLPLADIDNWQSHEFVGETLFNWQAADNQLCLISEQSASARIWEVSKTPLTSLLSWQWRPEATITGVNRQSRQGDDYAGRVYVAVKHPLFFWRSRVLAYVHASDQPINSHWPNPYTDQFHMWVVSKGTEPLWHTIERSIAADWQAAFGDQPKVFHAIGLMGDSDNSGQRTQLCLRELKIQTPS